MPGGSQQGCQLSPAPSSVPAAVNKNEVDIPFTLAELLRMSLFNPVQARRISDSPLRMESLRSHADSTKKGGNTRVQLAGPIPPVQPICPAFVPLRLRLRVGVKRSADPTSLVENFCGMPSVLGC